jgi:hypothetical protein
LRSLPTSSADIKTRVENYVASLGRPQISGIGPDEKLRVIFPGAGFDASGPRANRADPLALFAMSFPEEMTKALLLEIDRMTGAVVPIKERASRIAALTTEIEQLAYVEEALIADASANGEPIERAPSAPPQAVLGLRIAAAPKSTRAA